MKFSYFALVLVMNWVCELSVAERSIPAGLVFFEKTGGELVVGASSAFAKVLFDSLSAVPVVVEKAEDGEEVEVKRGENLWCCRSTVSGSPHSQCVFRLDASGNLQNLERSPWMVFPELTQQTIKFAAWDAKPTGGGQLLAKREIADIFISYLGLDLPKTAAKEEIRGKVRCLVRRFQVSGRGGAKFYRPYQSRCYVDFNEKGQGETPQPQLDASESTD